MPLIVNYLGAAKAEVRRQAKSTNFLDVSLTVIIDGNQLFFYSLLRSDDWQRASAMANASYALGTLFGHIACTQVCGNTLVCACAGGCVYARVRVFACIFVRVSVCARVAVVYFCRRPFLCAKCSQQAPGSAFLQHSRRNGCVGRCFRYGFCLQKYCESQIPAQSGFLTWICKMYWSSFPFLIILSLLPVALALMVAIVSLTCSGTKSAQKHE